MALPDFIGITARSQELSQLLSFVGPDQQPLPVFENQLQPFVARRIKGLSCLPVPDAPSTVIAYGFVGDYLNRLQFIPSDMTEPAMERKKTVMDPPVIDQDFQVSCAKPG